MTSSHDRARLAVGDWVEFEDEHHQVIGFLGASTRLRSENGHSQIIATAVLLADTSFGSRAEPPPETTDAPMIDPDAMLAGLPDEEKKRVRLMEAHLLEATTGYASGDELAAKAGEPRPEYRPELSLNARIEAKAAELGHHLPLAVAAP